MTACAIAMWSGPRNISTAMLRSWESRPDTYVCDEPFYAHFLRETGLDHPGRDEILAHQENDWRKVVDWLTGPVPEGRAIFYQKHMAHHLLPGMDLDWIGSVRNAMLIREPAEMLTSLIRIWPEPTVEDTGLPQQVELLERLERQGTVPPILDARDVLENPRGMLAALCDRLSIPFREEMLSWKPGPRATDGVWAKHWYGSVEQSTEFGTYTPKNEPVPDHLHDLLEQCESLYEHLARERLTV